MKTTLSAHQLTFYTKHRAIELELPHDPISLTDEKDQWRTDPKLLSFIKKKLGPLALDLSHSKQLRLGVSFWAKNPKKPAPIKEMVSLQSPIIACAITKESILPETRSDLGILPVPQTPQNVLFFDPQIILDWPNVQTDVFFIIFTIAQAVYIENTQDPDTHYLKKMGYFFGDLLKNQTHPLIF